MIVETVYLVAGASAGVLPDDQFVAFFSDRREAVAYRDSFGDDVRVYRVEPLPESAYWEWAVGHGFDGGPTQYVNESAARNCVNGGTLMRRRAGTKAWGAVSDA